MCSLYLLLRKLSTDRVEKSWNQISMRKVFASFSVRKSRLSSLLSAKIAAVQNVEMRSWTLTS